MSTSYKSLFPFSAPAPIEDYRYPEVHNGEGGDAAAPLDIGNTDPTAELLLRAHAEGVREGEERARKQYQEQLQQQHARVSETILHFQTELSEYYSQTESEVVRLALAIAAKILKREAQEDPALLTKIAAAVLKKLHHNTKVKLRVAPEATANWRDEMEKYVDGKIRMEVIGDESVLAGDCVLETELGSTDIGLDRQLAEIENGLFDLLAEKPRP